MKKLSRYWVDDDAHKYIEIVPTAACEFWCKGEDVAELEERCERMENMLKKYLHSTTIMECDFGHGDASREANKQGLQPKPR